MYQSQTATQHTHQILAPNPYPLPQSSDSATALLHQHNQQLAYNPSLIPTSSGQIYLPQQQQQQYPQLQQPNGVVAMPQRSSQARSMPTGHGYLNGGALPPTNSFLPVGSLGAIQGFQPIGGQAPPSAPQRHNSGTVNGGSNDNLTLGVHALIHGGHQASSTAAATASDGVSVSSQQSSQIGGQQQHPQRSQSYHVNVLNENEPRICTIKAYGLNATDTSDLVTLQIRNESMHDKGAFGTVFQARLLNDDNRQVAVKTVLQDKRYRNRELPLMKGLCHQNIVTLFYYYFSVKSSDPRADVSCSCFYLIFLMSNYFSFRNA